MINNRVRGLFNSLIACQVLLVALVACFCIGTTFGFLAGVNPEQLYRYPFYCGILVGGLLLEAINRSPKTKRVDLVTNSFSHQHPLAVRQTTFTLGALFVYVTITKDPVISRTVIVLLVPTIYATLLWSNRVLPRRLADWFFQDARQDRVLLIGDSKRASLLKDWLISREMLGLRTVGILTDEANPAGGWERVGGTADLERVVREQRITEAILLELPELPKNHEEMLTVLERNGTRLLILNNLDEKLQHRAVYFEEGDLSFVAPRNEPLENPMNRLMKRTLDLVIAVPVVCIVLPLGMIGVWVIHRLWSPGPLLEGEMKGGIQNRSFKMLKFRSAHVLFGGEGDGTGNGRGKFSVGSWLCRMRLDDLPKFYNVLRGEMSMVGPRAYATDQNIEFTRTVPHYAIRLSVKPGFTGLAQVRGFRGNIRELDRIRHQLESDLDYIENWRIALDFAIIIRTVTQMVLFAARGVLGAKETPSVVEPTGHESAAVRSADALAAASAYIPQSMRHDFRHILGIRFLNGSTEEAVALGIQGGLVVAPSAPVLLALKDDPAHRMAVANSGLAITDSGLMVLLWKLITGDNISRVSGLAYLKRLLELPQLRQPGCMFWVMPNSASMKHNLEFLQSQGLPVTEEDCYLAPQYDIKVGEIADEKLLEILRQKRPAHVFMAIGGGVQERLGCYLHRSLDYRPSIHCIGAAIGFLSGDQANIPMWADRFRLGWLCRCIHDPRRFVPRYWEARKLVRLMFDYHGRLPRA